MIIMDIKKATVSICCSRGGELLNWYGDGGLFLYDKTDDHKTMCKRATLCGIDLMHWLWDYNLFQNRVDEIIKVKVIIDTSVRTDLNEKTVISSKIYEKINDLEKNYTKPGTVLFSDSIFSQLSNKIRPFLSSIYIADYKYRSKYYEYSITVESQKL